MEDLRRDRDQLLAEAVERYQQGWSLLLSEEAQREAQDAQENRYAQDSWEVPIFEYVERNQSVTMGEIFIHALNIEHREKWRRADEIRIGNIMKKLGWSRKRMKVEGVRGYAYYRNEP